MTKETKAEHLTEGVHDKGIFKAVFLAGHPGSGKDYVLHKALTGHGLTEIPSEKVHDYLQGQVNYHDPSLENVKATVQKKARNVSELRHVLALHGRNGIIVNGSGDDHERVRTIKSGLEKLGYDTSMVLVHTDDETSKARNIERGARGSRTMHEIDRKEKWDKLHSARPKHAEMFGGNYHEFDNSTDLRNATPDIVKQKHEELMDLHTKLGEFVNTPPASENAQKWIESNVPKDRTYKLGRADNLPHPRSQAAQQASELGLQYHGNGKYGKAGKTTHYALHDNLEEIPEPKESDTKPKKKKVSEEFSLFLEGIGNEKLVEEFSIQDNSNDDDTTSNKFSSEAAKTLVQKPEGSTSNNGKKKLTLTDFKKQVGESIDKGIEPGCAMDSYSKEKIDKRGKATPIVSELTGDENLATISNQKEDELKKKGISLDSFKTKNVL